MVDCQYLMVALISFYNTDLPWSLSKCQWQKFFIELKQSLELKNFHRVTEKWREIAQMKERDREQESKTEKESDR